MHVKNFADRVSGRSCYVEHLITTARINLADFGIGIDQPRAVAATSTVGLGGWW